MYLGGSVFGEVFAAGKYLQIGILNGKLINTLELNKYFSVNNLYDNTPHNSRLLQVCGKASTV